MATTYLALLNGVASGDTLSAADLNKANTTLDRIGLKVYALLGSGRLSGWGLTSGGTTVASGAGAVGACYCTTTTSQVISGLAVGANYVFAKTDTGSPASGTIDFVARATSAAITNADGITNAVLLGKATYATGTGITAVDSTLRSSWTIDHGSLAGLSDDDHPAYMQSREVYLYGGAALIPATSAASTSTNGAGLKTTVVKFPALSTCKAAWDYYCPSDYSGTIVVTTDWLSSGLTGPIRFGLFSRAHSTAEAWDSTPASCIVAQQVSISGTNGHMRRVSHAWSYSKPTAGERGQIILRRDGANASDIMSGAARLLSAKITFASAR